MITDDNTNINATRTEEFYGSTSVLRMQKKPDNGGACEYGNEISGSIKCGEFLD